MESDIEAYVQSTRIMQAHSIHTTRNGNRLRALDVIVGPSGEDCSSWVDYTDWTVADVYRWLGY
jgi:hypothetical protein